MPTESPAPQTAQKSVLLIEDEPEIYLLLHGFLQPEGLVIDHASSNPINAQRNRDAAPLRINRDGTVVKVLKAKKSDVYYVEAVSKTTSAFSKRLKVEVRK